ncbi:MAG: tRNA pseudouridine(55) synthase, partial [Vulcanisaeta sp.]
MSFDSMGIEKTAMDVLRKYPLCDHCLGRLFARLGVGLTNEERGRAIKNYLLMSIHEKIISEGLSDEAINDLKVLALSGHEPSIGFLRNLGIEVSPMPCYVCGNSIFNRLDEWARNIADSLRSLNAEYRTFRLGTRVPSDLLSRELSITTEFNISTAESIKRELNRELGKRVSAILGLSFSRESPDVEVVLDITTGSVNIQLMPIYVFTRYRKIRRFTKRASIRWPTDYIAQVYGAQGIIVHSGGDEVSNVRVLGNGRPLVIQIIKPSKRPSLNDIIASLKNTDDYDVIFDRMEYVKGSIIRRIKARSREYVITYRVLAVTENPITDETIRSLHEYFRNRQVNQRLRVKGRVRRRVSMVYELNGRAIGDRLMELLIRCQGNLHVRGFVHGGFGDIEPSIAGTLGFGVKPIEIDILR